MNREQILSILYEMAIVIGSEVRLRPLLTKTLQRLLFHTSFPCGMIFLGTEAVRSEGYSAEAVGVRLEVSMGDMDLADHDGSDVPVPAALLRGGIELGEGGGLLDRIPCRKDYYKVFLRLPINEFGVILLLAPRVPETGLPLTQIFQPVMNNFAKAIHLCRSYEAFTEGIITDQRLAEAALKDMSYRNRLILDSVGEGICGLDLEGNATFANPAAARMLGFGPGELEGRPLHDIVYHGHSHANDTAFEDCPIIRTIREGSRKRVVDGLFSRKDGSVFPAEYASTPLMEAGRIVGAVLVFQDITERKRAESVAQARLRMLEAAYTTGTTTLDFTLRWVLDEIETQTGSVIGFYHFLEEDQETLSLQNWSTNTRANMCTAEGKGRHYNISEAGVWVDCVRKKQPVIHNDFALLPHRKELPPGHAPIVRMLVAPIIRGDRIVAIIGVGNKETDYNETDVQTVLLLGDFSWEIVERKRAEEELLKLNEELEERVKERTSELEHKNAELKKLNRLFVGRELRMIELKEKIRTLEEKVSGKTTS